jgi:hypothetical protein
MAIELPSAPGIRSARPRLIDFGGEQEGALGGPSKRIDRAGNRYGIEITLPPLPEEPDGRIYLSRLRRAKKEGARYAFPQPGFDVGAPGAAVVDGAGQTGTSLALRGMTPRYPIKEGRFFNIIQDGRYYLYAAAAQAIVAADGTVTVTLEDMLRRITVDGATCVFGRPMIEGSIGEVSWDVMLDPFIGVAFSITEKA